MMLKQPFFVPAVIFFIAAIPLIFRLIPRNRWYGIRTAQTLADEQTWYRINRLGGWVFIFSSALYLLVAKFYPTSGSDFSRWLVHLFFFAGPLIVSVLLILKSLRKP